MTELPDLTCLSHDEKDALIRGLWAHQSQADEDPTEVARAGRPSPKHQHADQHQDRSDFSDVEEERLDDQRRRRLAEERCAPARVMLEAALNRFSRTHAVK